MKPSPGNQATIAGAVHRKVEPSVRTRPRSKPRPRPARSLPKTCFHRPQPDWPCPQSQSFSRSYGSNLPTSLTYIVLSTRGCAPWRPAADMGTAWHENHTVSVGFSRADRDAPDTARAAVLYGNPVSLSPGKPIPGSESLTKKRELFPGSRPTSPTSFALPHVAREDQSPCPGSGILTRFPFDPTRAQIENNSASIQNGLLLSLRTD